jgi:hypothetical protein
MEENIMNISKTIILTLLFAGLFSAQSTVQAQEEENQETPYWYVLSFKVPWAKVDTLEKLVEKYTVPIVAEAKKRGTILDYKFLIHHTGDEYNVVVMQKYASWATIDEGPQFNAAFEAIEPDKSKRDEVNKSFDWIFEGTVHKDNIYREISE